MKMNTAEIHELYYVSEYVSDVNEVINRFRRKEDQ